MMRLSILIFCCFHGTCWATGYCIYQPNTLHVKEGESVTIPCSYTHPAYPSERSQFIVSWGEADGIDCSTVNKDISAQYRDRISTVHHPENRTASITIRGLKAEDGITVCCAVSRLTTGYQPFSWTDDYGTSLKFADRAVTQVAELIAVPGEDVVIPCHYPGKVVQVTWYREVNFLCAVNSTRIHRWPSTETHDGFSLVNFPADFSLRIHRVQKDNKSYFYCCSLITTTAIIMEPRYATELTLAGPPSSSSPFMVTQPYNITGRRGESAILTCFYSGYKESDVLGVNIYWRLGNITGPYVYHPYKEMVHPTYKGRTEITGPADLHIRGLQMSDDSTYYCFVMIRLCRRGDIYEKQVQYGEGTKLSVTDQVRTVTLIFASYLAFKLLISLVIFVLAFFYLRDNESEPTTSADPRQGQSSAETPAANA